MKKLMFISIDVSIMVDSEVHASAVESEFFATVGHFLAHTEGTAQVTKYYDDFDLPRNEIVGNPEYTVPEPITHEFLLEDWCVKSHE